MPGWHVISRFSRSSTIHATDNKSVISEGIYLLHAFDLNMLNVYTQRISRKDTQSPVGVVHILEVWHPTSGAEKRERVGKCLKTQAQR